MNDLITANQAGTSRAECSRWWTIVLSGVNGWTPEEAAQREGAIWFACRHYPADVWSERTIRDVWRVTRFVPTPGEVMAVFDAVVAEIEARQIAKQRSIAFARQPVIFAIEAVERYEPPPPPPWALDRSMRRPSGPTDPGDRLHSTAHPPIRTVAEQLAALRGDG
jgi:hypothetical protein